MAKRTIVREHKANVKLCLHNRTEPYAGSASEGNVKHFTRLAKEEAISTGAGPAREM